MWLFRHKYHAYGTHSRYKARLVANGSTQLAGVDIDETFSLVVKPGTIRTVLSLATSRYWPVHQLDVKNAFLHGDLSETVYMHSLQDFGILCTLIMFVYYSGLCMGSSKPLELDFNGLLHILLELVFIIGDVTPLYLYTNSRPAPPHCHSYKKGTNTAYLLLYVDDIVLTASSETLLQQVIGMFLSQRKYAVEILGRAHMVNYNSSRTPVDTES
ncbi:ribonuclease H-like domain-containing protein [Tanacetum coccineum]